MEQTPRNDGLVRIYAVENAAVRTASEKAATPTVEAAAAVSGGLVSYNVGDVAPNGGLAYYVMMKDKSGAVYYKGYYFPKVQAAMGNDNAATKSGSISFQTASTTFTVMKCEKGDWMQTEIHTTEALAKAWVDTCLTSTAG